MINRITLNKSAFVEKFDNAINSSDILITRNYNIDFKI